jgi:hypothetical protein
VRSLEEHLRDVVEENTTCDICTKKQDREDIFLSGFQDPQNKRVALLRICRTDFVMLTSPDLRNALDKHWYA